ncbi:uncharacterized protein AMSG_08851 [Thecamonas trahens ATCC 50062]|uniref:EF-hand domain-containing protein n=1 Tax=Thecamonas trahens ATCC 50062 TaxID=461836 RepID=A0A0L0DM02_THETB|nr:hypothetical protein AMSG_08851 [Thecamonas trahens ATCC 50062]KNC53349.1 hypothetical protein AMSG_08851 [Thecamonas trahens ATCC 50062]|eukprot:XP_013754397.1 hypothetical protein AMSG_08851 [Thecamonas trahens ATCC 50062]
MSMNKSWPWWKSWGVLLGAGAALASSVAVYRWLTARAHEDDGFDDSGKRGRDTVRHLTEMFISQYPNGMTKEDVLAYQSEFTENNIDVLFNAIDSDGNGVVSCEEFLLWKLAMSAPESAARFTFHMWDTDHSGSLSFSEVMRMFLILRSANAIKTSKDANELARELFAKADVNHNGFISETEFMAAMSILHDMDESEHPEYFQRLVNII